METFKAILEMLNSFFADIVPVGDILWTFPQNFDWYANIPIIGNIPFAIWLLVGMGAFFSLKTRFVQFRYFKQGIKVLTRKKRDKTGVSPLAAFLLSTAMRVGPGNIIGVTGAISVGGPGAMFWMWFSALLGMASSFIESTLAQIFKEKDGDEFVGGLPYYGQKLLGNKKWIGKVLAILFIIYAMLSIPIQTFHVFTATGEAVGAISGVDLERTSIVYYVIAAILIAAIIAAVFGGIKRVTALTDKMVPVMAVIYFVIIFGLAIVNIRIFPGFLADVFGGAFKPQAIFGGAFGVALAQGIKRGLLSNEAGQGTITMSAAVSEQDHPVEQGFVQSLGVFLDTIVICTVSGFVVCGAKLWSVQSFDWGAIKDSKIDVFLESLKVMTPGTAADGAVSLIICICYALFAFTTLLGLITFATIAGSRISKSKTCANVIRSLGAIIFVPFGALCVLAGLELDNIWYMSDLINISLVFVNAPIILYGAKYVYKALEDYVKHNGRRFVSEEIGIESEVWTKEERKRIENM